MLKHLLWYLAETIDYAICYEGDRDFRSLNDSSSDLILHRYTDTDWAGDWDSFKFTIRYIFTLNEGAISWCSIKQHSVILLTCEAEYMTSVTAVQEAVWERNLLQDLYQH